MKALKSSILQFLLFGALLALAMTQGPVHSTAVIALFVVGELGGTSVLCSLIVKQYGQSFLPHWLRQSVVGYVLSHICILNLLHLGFFSSNTAQVPHLSTLAWMDLTLRVGLVVVLASTVGVLSEARVRKFAEPRIRKYITAA